MSHFQLLSLLIAVIFPFTLLGGSVFNPVPSPGDQVTPFPTRVGTTWVYESKEGQFTETITKTEQKDGVALVTIESIDSKGHASPCRVISVSAKGVFHVKGNPFFVYRCGAWSEEPWCLIPELAPSHEPRKSEVQFEGGVKIRTTMRFGATERVKTPAGTFNAMKVEWSSYSDLNKTRESYWFAPGVGLVQIGDPPTYILKSFTPGK